MTGPRIGKAGKVAAECGGESSRERFPDAADPLFIRAISAAAGTSPGALSRHWSGKQQFFAEMFRRHFEAGLAAGQ